MDMMLKLQKLLCQLLLCVTAGQATATAMQPSVWVHNETTNHTVMSHGADQIRPMASVTKLMTAIVTLDHDVNLDRVLAVRPGISTHLPAAQYTRRELLAAMLVRSDNGAAETLARDHPGGRRAFIQQMNRRGLELGMVTTRFVDPTGLSRHNVTTARQLGSLIRAAASYPVIQKISVQKQVAIEAHVGQRVRIIALPHTLQPVLLTFDNIQVTKTGFTVPAGWCAALQVKKNQQIIQVVVLGAENKAQRLDLVQGILYNHLVDDHPGPWHKS